MIIVMKPNAEEKSIAELTSYLKEKGMTVQINAGVECTVLGVIGDTHIIDKDRLSMRPNVERIVSVQEPYKKANRKFHPDNSVIMAGNVSIGGERLAIMAGPCSVESEEQIIDIAKDVKQKGANILRGGAFKPRTSPYAFQGLEAQGLDLLSQARGETGLPVISEIISMRHLEVFCDKVDILQIGARNMQNFDLLKEVGKIKKPILLKRGFSNTLEELLMSAEYIMSEGNPNVILCERGIRTFEKFTRNTLDISAIPALKKLSHLPVIVDPSHAAGMSWMVPALAMSAIVAGADGLLIEVHNDPAKAVCDGPQSITPQEFDVLMKKLTAIAEIVGRKAV